LQIREGASGPELWSLTLFLEPARTYVLEHKYRWASVAVSFSSIDPLTGEDMGPTMSSVALTNTPFIAGMAELAASALESNCEPESIVAPAEIAKAKDMDVLKIACAMGLDDNSGEEEILAAASSAMQSSTRLAELREKHSNLLLAMGCENEDAAISRYIDLSMAAAEWEKAKPVLEEMRLAEEARANEAVIRDVDAAMKAHSLPESVRDALILQRRSNADAFAAKFPVLSPASANLAQPAPSAPVQASAAQQARRELASAVDVSSYSGATLHLRAQAYVAATMPGIAGNYETVHKLARAMVRDGRVR
jgi:phage I-like protein